MGGGDLASAVRQADRPQFPPKPTCCPVPPKASKERFFFSRPNRGEIHTHSIHGTGIFTYMYHKNQLNVSKYTIHGCYGTGSSQIFCEYNSAALGFLG